ncbi:MAG: pyrroline-5-carboxylate reductase [Lachnospiraceae bacterium]|nr:pyrroline-5-carboxylate reductase [Lachnospiraceae bacterium]
MSGSRIYKLGFVGCGHMGLAIARGAKNSGFLKPEQICVADLNPKVLDTCRAEGFAVMESSVSAAEHSEITLLAVTPQVCDAALFEIGVARVSCLLSIVTGVSIAYLQDALGDVPVIRAMPNTPLQIGYGSTAITASENCPEDALAFVKALFSTMGVVREVPEAWMNAMVCVHGSIPAYVYYFTQCILEDLKARGIDEAAARDLLVQCVVGSGRLMQENPGKPLQAFIDEVCSKGGTTIQAIGELRDRDLPGIVRDANEKCIRRAEELGR